MRTVNSLRAGYALGVALGLVLATGTARAEFSTERPGSIVLFPKVVNADGRDTIIQVTNTSNIVRRARCFYVNGAPRNPNLVPNPVTNPPLWQVTDFEITLTRQQPTHWQASTGRPVNPVDGIAGLDPGLIPPVPPGFTGELVCAEVDDSGNALSGNALKGEATLSDSGSADIAIYNAITVEGFESNDGDNALELDNVEYSACPAGLHMNFPADGSEDAAISGLGSGDSVVNSSLTLVPCSRDFETSSPSSVVASFLVRNEFEEPLSASTTVTCWASLPLGTTPQLQAAFTESGLGTQYGYARITPAAGLCSVSRGVCNTDNDCAPSGGTCEMIGDGVGLLGVLDIRRGDSNTGALSTAAANLHFIGNEPGTCSVSLAPCSVTADCGSSGGTCSGVTNTPGAVIRLQQGF